MYNRQEKKVKVRTKKEGFCMIEKLIHFLEIGSVVITYFTIPIFLCYLPAIIACWKWKRAEREFQYQLKLLDESKFFERYMICETRPLGLGEEPSGSISFEQALKNQTLATNSILCLMADM